MSSIPRHVLVAVDGSVASMNAARVAIDFARTWQARVRAVGVLDGACPCPSPHCIAPRCAAPQCVAPSTEGLSTAEGPSTATPPATAPPECPHRRTQLRDALDYVCRVGVAAGVPVEGVLRNRPGAEPYELILEEIDDWSADLVFVGRREHRGLGRALLGSQAEHVLEFTRLPVVVVPEAGPSAPPPPEPVGVGRAGTGFSACPHAGR